MSTKNTYYALIEMPVYYRGRIEAESIEDAMAVVQKKFQTVRWQKRNSTVNLGEFRLHTISDGDDKIVWRRTDES